MSQTVFAPFCLAKARDNAALASMLAVFGTPLARKIGLGAVAQRYITNRGDPKKTGKPIFLLQDPAAGKIAPADDDRISDEDLKALTAFFDAAGTSATFQQDMLTVSSDGLWLIAFPRLLVMQAEDIGMEIRAISRISKVLHQSTWARSAYAMLRVAPPDSSHETLATLVDIHEAIDVLTDFRPEAIADAIDQGYDLGPFMASDLERGISTG
jgi:hypothetical protein